jgi:Uma2 family endonuclease
LFLNNAKAEFYFYKTGVPEYRVVSPTHKTVQVFLLREGSSRYTVYDAAAAVPSAALAGLTVNLAGVFSTV